MKRILAALLFLPLLFAPAVNAEPASVTKEHVWVDPRVEEYSYIYDMIVNALDPADDITVTIYEYGPGLVQANTTHVIAYVNDFDRSIAVYGDTEWPDHKTAVALLARSEEDHDPVNRILRFVRDTHEWQRDNKIDR